MTEYVVAPDVEQALVDVLPGLLGFPWHGRVPKPRPNRFGRVELTGGAEINVVVGEPSLLVENWAQTDAQAFQDARRTSAALKSLGTVGDVVFYKVRAFSLPQNLPDPTTNQARYTALYAIRVRGLITTTL
jgi:hypothetical protein